MTKPVKILITVAMVGILLACLFQLFATWMTDLLSEDLGSRNWHVVLPNDYEIVQISGREIVLVDNAANGSTEFVVDAFVRNFCFNDSFVGVSTKGPYAGDAWKFYLVDTVQDIRYGPYTQEEFAAACDRYNTGDLGSWISTVPAPDIASYH